MTGKLSIGEVIPLPHSGHGRADDLRAVVPVRAEDALTSGDTTLDNVVPFVRPGANDNARNAPDVVLPTDLARLPDKPASRRFRQLVGAALSLAVHAGALAFLLLRQEPPLASIGLEVISVELVLGATAPAGVAPTPGENETQATSAPETPAAENEKAEQKATEQPQDVRVAETETAPEVKTEQPVTEPPKEYETAAVPNAQPAEPQPPVGMVETPNPDTATAAPQDKPAPAENFTMLPPPEKATEKKPDSKPAAKKAAPPKPVKDAKPAPERRRIAAPTRDTPAKQAKPSTPSSQANNIGVGRSSQDSNYPGTVRAHLARYKQSVGSSTGTAAVSFTIGGGGSAGGVRLTRSSGVAAIDQEVQAMVRRASPFPPPPGGRAQSFSIPVNFRTQ